MRSSIWYDGSLNMIFFFLIMLYGKSLSLSKTENENYQYTSVNTSG